MSARTETAHLRDRLKKELEHEDVNEERVKDILKCLDRIAMTHTILKETKVGVVVTSVKKKLRGNAVELCRSIICKWKQLVPKPPANDVPSKPKQAVRVSPIPAGDTDNKDPQSDDKEAEFKPNLPDKRKKAVDMLSQSLEDGTTVPEVAKSLAYAIEQAINDMHPHDTDSRGFANKVRSLKANLQRNIPLRDGVLSGEIVVDRLVRMTDKELATKEQRMAREESKALDLEANRSDWNAVNRDRILKNLGIESGGGEYKCRKCKSGKTSQHSQQTRSGDEPMTVFVLCLNCGNRWRTV